MQRKESRNNRRWAGPRRRAGAIGRFVGEGLIFLIKLYRKMLSPLLGHNCRFVPSCSKYAIEAIRRLGPIKGSAKAVLRLLRCSPLFKGGYDPVGGR